MFPATCEEIYSPTKHLKNAEIDFNASPSLATATVHAHVNKYKEMSPYAVEVLQNTNVDYCLTGADTVYSTLKLQQEMSEIMMTTACNLTKWASNSELVMVLLTQLKEPHCYSWSSIRSTPLKPLTCHGT